MEPMKWVACLAKKMTGTITITSNYYNSESNLEFVDGFQDTKLTLLNTEVKGKTSDGLRDLTAASTETEFTRDGWSVFNWNFTDGKYPSLKSYEFSVNNSTTPPTVTQVMGELLCGQPADFVQCTP